MKKLNTVGMRVTVGAVIEIDGAHYVVEDARQVDDLDLMLHKRQQPEMLKNPLDRPTWRVTARKLKPGFKYDHNGRRLTFFQIRKPYKRARYIDVVSVVGQMKKTVVFS